MAIPVKLKVFEGPLAVSYTHLDVYKRQRLRCSLNNLPAKATRKYAIER